NVLITFIAASAVISGQMSLGMMLAVQYIIGVLNVPILEFVNFSREFQDAKISLDRIGEIHSLKNEETSYVNATTSINEPRSISIEDVSFQYEGPTSPKALDHISLTIDYGKITAIVGTSGSGKTTLLKLLLKYYAPTAGVILLGNDDLLTISARDWRSQCGVVMQEGYLFSDTIANNVCIATDNIDQERLIHAVTVNIPEII
ncbi:MAG: ATP-binding cassette domain-containing protein, partial [Cytophagales bacterium]